MDRTVYQALQDMVVGQDRAKVSLSRLIEMHFAWFPTRDRLHRAPNSLVIGPTGTGKTHAIRIIAETLKLPLAVIDSTRLVVGASGLITFEDVIVQLVKSARLLIQDTTEIKYSPEELAEHGIIFLDEFDKLAYSDTNDASAAVQRRLLQFVEGDKMFLELSEESAPRTIDTSGILFVASGAFSGIRSKHVTSARSISTARTPEVGRTIQPRDVHEYGFIHELVARLPVIIRFDALGPKELREILDHPIVSPINFYDRYFHQIGVTLDIPADTRNIVAEDAASSELGARGLHQELFPVLSTLASEIRNEGMPDFESATILQEYVLTPGQYSRLKAKSYQAE